MTKLPDGGTKLGQIIARVIVDAYAYHKFSDEQLLDDDNRSAAVAEDEILEVETEAQKQADDDRRETIKPFAEEHYLVSIPDVEGYHNENRAWCQLFLGSFTEIVLNDHAYDKLVLDKGKK